MLNDICGNWTVYHSLAVAFIAGSLLIAFSTCAITINEWLARRADEKLARKLAKQLVAVDPDTVYNHAIHGH